MRSIHRFTFLLAAALLHCGSDGETSTVSTASDAAASPDQGAANDAAQVSNPVSDGATSTIPDSRADAIVESGGCPSGQVYCPGCSGAPGRCYSGGCPGVACPVPTLAGSCGMGTCPANLPTSGAECTGGPTIPLCCNYQIEQKVTGCICDGTWACNATAMCGCVGQ